MAFMDLYKGKRVLITGHTGFIGSWLTKWLVHLGSDVLGYSLNPQTNPNMFDSIDVKKDISDIRGNILDKELLRNTILEFEPEIVFHLAAQPIVLDSLSNPLESFETNVIGTGNLLDSLRLSGGVKTVTVMTSDKAYLNNEWVYPYREIDPLGGKDPYSASKACQDILVSSFRESYFKDVGTAISSVRAGNIIGGGDWSRYRLIPDLVRALSSNGEVTIRNPYSVRPWQFVLDAIHGVLVLNSRMWEDNLLSGSWNFGPVDSRLITVEQLVDEFIKNWGFGKYIIKQENETKEAKYLQLDTSKASTILSWTSIYNLAKSLEETMKWYKAYYEDPSNASKVTESQIEDFVRALSRK